MPAPKQGSGDELKTAILRYWGYHEFRPLQERAMRAALAARDSLVVLPTGGGKSLCYQAPAIVRGGTTVVVSPLIALMKDQVDGLRALGVPATQIDSSQSTQERSALMRDLRAGAIRLLFVSPERLANENFCQLLREVAVHTFAIDEAHCISHWGHDFRPEYRQMSRLRELFPDASVHAYTATATEQVRHDIITQLGLQNPEVLVGSFDRPNLTYRVLPRQDTTKQALDILKTIRSGGGIIYCISRREVDELSASLIKRGIKAVAYHAGMMAESRTAAQDAFLSEEVDVVVATVAFGMGIDRSNIRFVLHTGMPKSIEHYQQETGRAGRDGLPAECVLLYSGGDIRIWKSIIEKSAQEGGAGPEYVSHSLQHLNHIDRYARGAICRHRALVEYFGQTYENETCGGACDICAKDTENIPDALVVAQKILSCVARVNQGYGITHVISVLRGENTDNVRKRGHDQLSTFGLLHEHSKPALRDWIYQLIGQGLLLQVGDDYPILKLNDASWEVMRGQRTEFRLVQLARRERAAPKAEGISWEGVDQELFEKLRVLRKHLADQRGWPPYRVFGDVTLREMARVRPSTLERMLHITGVGDAKLSDFGQAFLDVIDEQAEVRNLSRDQRHGPARSVPTPPTGVSEPRTNPIRETAYALFRLGTSLDEVVKRTGRAPSTIHEYLCQYIREEQPASVAAWVPDDIYQQVLGAAQQFGGTLRRPIFVALGEKVSYEHIGVVLAHLASQEFPS